MQSISRLSLFATLFIAATVCAGEIGTNVPMTLKGSQTYYVSGRVAGVEPTEFMVDTGSSYMTINQNTLDQLKTSGQADYLRDLIGVLANGDEVVRPVYRIPRITLGNNCEMFDVEAVVFPGKTRQILGLNVLRQAAPFRFTVDPPQLQLSNCSHHLSQTDPLPLGPASSESLPASPKTR
ncbi:MAG: retropepsin-like aspartic protease [Gammaproteobacteria bacterium]|nr:retropepsin-like aspartic protease [Gammaproteobacteria bacterium]